MVLAWVYDRRTELSDPLSVVEQLYADFGYPAELRGFVRYMPPGDHYEPQAHTHAETSAAFSANGRSTWIRLPRGRLLAELVTPEA